MTITLQKSTIFLFILLFLFSCKDNRPAALLKQAQNEATENPSNALILLDSIKMPEKNGKRKLHAICSNKRTGKIQ